LKREHRKLKAKERSSISLCTLTEEQDSNPTSAVVSRPESPECPSLPSVESRPYSPDVLGSTSLDKLSASSTMSTPLLQGCAHNERRVSVEAKGMSSRFKKRQREKQTSVRPWYLVQLQRLGLITLDKAAPNEHDTLFFFHEASPAIYMHFLGDLIFFQSVVTSMYLVLWCVLDVQWGLFQIATTIIGISGPAFNLFWLIPKVVGKTVIVTSIEHMKDKGAVEAVIFDTKKHQLLESLKILSIARMEGKVERIIQEDMGDGRRSRQQSMTGGISSATKEKYESIFHRDFSKKKQKDIKHMFQLFDADGSGSIDKDEMFAVFTSMGINLSSGLVQCANQLWDLVDSDGSGHVEWDEFCILMAMVLYKDDETKRKDDEALFMKFDEDNSGSITMAELAAGFESLGVDLDVESIANLVGEVFKHSRQKLSQDDFVLFMNGLEDMAEKAE